MHPQLLLSAYSCDPQGASEAMVGWRRAIEAAKYCDTWVICCEQNCAEPIQRFLNAHGTVPGLTFVFVPKSDIESKLSKSKLSWYFAYNLWHRRVLRVARQLHEQVGFDLVHQVNFIGFREPGYLWKLEIPFVWGPVGGTQNYPWRFLPGAGVWPAATEAMRNVLNWLQLRYRTRVRRAAQRAAVLLTANSEGQRSFAQLHGVSPLNMLETGLAQMIASGPKARTDNGPFRILWSGYFRPGKALELLINALSRWSEGVPYELRIVGAGTMMRRWQGLARRNGVENHTTWMGWLPWPQALAQFKWADVFVFTSLRDTSGNVVLEALSAGVPVVCLDHQGTGDIVTPRCGIKLSVTNRDFVVQELRKALQTLAHEHNLLSRLSQGALERAREYLWVNQGKRMADVYHHVLSSEFRTGSLDAGGRSIGKRPAILARPHRPG